MSIKLPAPLTRFVGREAELAEAAALLAGARLLTLTGPGGAGKTRLAVQLAANVSEKFPDGIWFVDFSALSGGEYLWDQLAATLGVREPTGGGTLADAVGGRLAARLALIVLDNCEHVVDAAAQVTNALLGAAPTVKLLATSREPLQVGGEVTWPVPPLSEADGVELFSDRARQAWPQFTLREWDLAAARAICHRLDGMPLAIELAAARTRALAPARIAAELQDHFRLLPSGPRTAPSRQSTLAASFDWSYELLSDAERALLRQLSVFAGGFDVEAALAVCPAASIELLASLTDRSLIMVEKRTDGTEPRYRMLETVREYAANHLDEAQEVEPIRTRHRDYYLALAETAEPGTISPDDARWHALLMAEQENLRAAMAWSRDHDQAEELARMVSALGWFWMETVRLHELRRWFEPAAQRADHVSPRLRARLRVYEAGAAFLSGRGLGEVPALANEALGIARAAGDKQAEAVALVLLGVVAGLIGGADAARPYFEEAVPVARAGGFPYGIVMALEFFAILRMFQSEPDEIARLLDEAASVARVSLARHSQLTPRAFIGNLALIRGRLAEAHEILATVVADGRAMLDFNYLHSLIDLGLVEMFQGNHGAARGHVDESRAAVEKYEAEGRSAAGVGLHATLVLGWIQLAAGEAAQAREALAAVTEAVRSSIMRPLIALPLVTLAQAQLHLGVLDEAAASLDEASSTAGSRKYTWLLGRVGLLRARLRAKQGELLEAESLAHEALKLGRDADDQMGLVDGLEFLAMLAAERDSRREAVRVWAAADSRRSKLGYARFPIEQSPYEAVLARAKQALGQDLYNEAWAEGSKLSVDLAIAYAARGRGERKRPTTGWASLTPSELEVVRLVGEHLSNPEIAQRLFVSRATVKTHLLHIFAKLGIDSRSELVAEAFRRGLMRQTSS